MSEHNYLMNKTVTFVHPLVSDEPFEVRVAGVHRDLGVTIKCDNPGEGRRGSVVRENGDIFCLNKDAYATSAIAKKGLTYEEYYDFLIGQLTTGAVDITNHPIIKEHYTGKTLCGMGACAFQ